VRRHALIGLLLVATLTAAVPAAGAPGFATRAQQQLDARLGAAIEAGRIPAAIAIAD
jgi:hypothetical protein